jgi:hypothetical protein
MDNNTRERCWKRRAAGSRFCGQHADYPDFSVVVARWVAERQRQAVPPGEEDFMGFLRAQYPDASYQLPKVHEFHKFVASFANTGAAAERARSRSPRRS